MEIVGVERNSAEKTVKLLSVVDLEIPTESDSLRWLKSTIPDDARDEEYLG